MSIPFESLRRAAADRAHQAQAAAAVRRASGRTIRRRMADLIVNHVTATGAVTRDDLLGNFSAEQIAAHFEGAMRLTGLDGAA